MNKSAKEDTKANTKNQYLTIDFWKFTLGFSLIIIGVLGLIFLLRQLKSPAGDTDLISTTSVATTSLPAQASSSPPGQ